LFVPVSSTPAPAAPAQVAPVDGGGRAHVVIAVALLAVAIAASIAWFVL